MSLIDRNRHDEMLQPGYFPTGRTVSDSGPLGRTAFKMLDAIRHVAFMRLMGFEFDDIELEASKVLWRIERLRQLDPTYLQWPADALKYLHTCFSNSWRDLNRARKIKKQRYTDLTAVDLIPASEPSGIDPIEWQEFMDGLALEILNLPFYLRAVGTLRFMEMRPSEDIAEILEMSPSTIRSYIARAAEALRDYANWYWREQ